MKIPVVDELVEKRHDVFRLGLQSAVAAVSVYLIMRWLGWSEMFVALISAVFILQQSSDGSFNAGLQRLLATAIGSAVGIVCLFALPAGWGTATALAITMFILNGVSVARPGWQYGAVAAVALSLGAEQDVIQVTVDRGLAIGLGVVVGVIVSLVVWPEFARKRFDRHISRATRALSDRLEQVTEAISHDTDPVRATADRRYHQAFNVAEDSANAIRVGEKQTAHNVLGKLRRVYNSTLILDRTLEGGYTLADEKQAEIGDLLERVREHLTCAADGKIASNEDLPDNAKTSGKDRRSRVAGFGLSELLSDTHDFAEALVNFRE